MYILEGRGSGSSLLVLVPAQDKCQTKTTRLAAWSTWVEHSNHTYRSLRETRLLWGILVLNRNHLVEKLK